MAVKLLSADAKQLVERRIVEWRCRDLLGFRASQEWSKSLTDHPTFWEKTNEKAIPVGAPASLWKAMFGKNIEGRVILCRNAFFEVKGLYSEEEAQLLVQQQIKKERGEMERMKSADAMGGAPLTNRKEEMERSRQTAEDLTKEAREAIQKFQNILKGALTKSHAVDWDQIKRGL
jgi:hypothetical protein